MYRQEIRISGAWVLLLLYLPFFQHVHTYESTTNGVFDDRFPTDWRKRLDKFAFASASAFLSRVRKTVVYLQR